MSVAFTPNTTMTRNDLNIFLQTPEGNPTNAYEISYALYFVDPGPPEAEVVLGGNTPRVPENPAVGEYYASFQVPANAQVGDYRIRWSIREKAGYPVRQAVQEFAVVAAGTQTSNTQIYTVEEQDMIRRLRIWMRDQDPDRHYHFRPPEGEASIGAYNQVFGFVWEDYELHEYLRSALDYFNLFPPETEDLSDISTLVQRKKVWCSAVLYGAVSLAAMALMSNWTVDGFSVGGDEKVTVRLPDGTTAQVTMQDLWNISQEVSNAP